MSPPREAALSVWRRPRWLNKGEPMPAWIFPSPEGSALEERNVRTVFARLLAKADMRRIASLTLLGLAISWGATRRQWHRAGGRRGWAKLE